MRWPYKLGVWAAVLYVVLRLDAWLPAAPGAGNTCGPWGCGPRLTALISWHGFWGLLPLAVVSTAGEAVSSAALRRAGTLLLVLAVSGLLVTAIVQAATWLPEVDDLRRRFFLQRCLFVWATVTDVPMPALLIGGLGLRFRTRTRRRAGETVPEATVHAVPETPVHTKESGSLPPASRTCSAAAPRHATHATPESDRNPLNHNALGDEGLEPPASSL